MSESGLIYLLWSDLVGMTRTRGVPLQDFDRRLESGLGWACAGQAMTPFEQIADNPWGPVDEVRQIPDLDDQLFMLTRTGMMIRMVSGQTKETLGKVTKGTRIMELRNSDRSGYVDEIIFVARLPADLVDSSDADEPTLEEE
mgnify:CR=1 FL=1